MSVKITRHIKLLKSSPLNLNHNICTEIGIHKSAPVNISNIANSELEKAFRKTEPLISALSESKILAGFKSVEIKLPSSFNEPVRIVGANDLGGAIVSEFLPGNEKSITSEIINVDECEEAQKKFEDKLRRYAVVRELNRKKTGLACTIKKKKAEQIKRRKKAYLYQQLKKSVR